MGKGFNNYMTKKFFHPGSKDNIKRVWMAEQKSEFDKKKQEELLAQYQREQEMLSNRALLGDEKAKLGLSFMYDAPPGAKKELEKEDDEPEYRFEWQRRYNAPRESYAKGNEEIRDQPFGIEVRNVRCIKCHQWGHVNTDKICPLFGKNITAEPPQPGASTSSLVEDMRGDGLSLKTSILTGMTADPRKANERMVDDEEDPEVQFLKSLTKKQKKKLLKKLDKLATKGEKSKKKKKKHKKSKDQSSGSESSDSEADEGHTTADRAMTHQASSHGRRHDRSPSPQNDRYRSRSPLRGRDDRGMSRSPTARNTRRSMSPRRRNQQYSEFAEQGAFRERRQSQYHSHNSDGRKRKQHSYSPATHKSNYKYQSSDSRSYKRKSSNSPDVKERKRRHDSSSSEDSHSADGASRRCQDKDDGHKGRPRYHSYDRRNNGKSSARNTNMSESD